MAQEKLISLNNLSTFKDNLGTAAVKDVPESGNASITQVVMGNDTRLSDARPASDVSSWAKASTKPSYTASEVGLGNVTNDKQIKGLASGTTENHVVTFGSNGYTVKDSGFTIAKSVPSDAKFTDTTYSNATTAVAGLMSTVDKSKLDGIAEGATANTGTVTSVGLTAGDGISISGGPVTTSGSITVTNKGVRSVAQGTTNGTINVNTNGSTADVAVKGLGSLAYKSSLSKSDVGLGNVANLDQSKAITSITRSGTTFTATALDGTTSSFTQKDDNTTYSGANGISLSGTTFSNSGVRAIAEGTEAGTINVNTNGSTANVAVKDAGKAIKSITRSGTTFTATAIDGTTSSFTQQDNNTTYTGANGVSLSGTTFSNSGVRSIATGTSNGTINVNTNGSTANVAVKGLGNAAYTNVTDTYSATGTAPVSGKAVAAAIAAMPEPMIFKGSLGTGGTITTLPTAAADNEGFTYKVITAGTYASQAAKVGDTFISDGSAWILIPSGDEPSGTVTSVGISNGGGIGISGSPITSSGTITISNAGVRSISEGTAAGTINVNTNGSTANVAVKDAGKAIKSITRSGTTFTATAIDGTTSSFTQQDNNTWTAMVGATSAANGSVGYVNATPPKDGYNTKYLRADGTWQVPPDNNTTYGANNGVGLSGTTFYNSGVRAIAQGTTNGTINVNTNGSTADVAVKGLGSAAYTASTAYATSGHNHDSTYLKLAGGTLTGNINFANGGTATRGITATIADSDAWRMVGGQTATNAGYLEIATADDYNEPIYVRQYQYGDSSTPFGSVKKEAVLLDGSGNTSFPGTVTAASFSGSIASATGLTKSQVTTALGYTPPTTDTNTTYSAGSNITLTGTVFSLTKANVTGALGYTPPTTNTWTAMVGATSAANGSVGYVNAVPPKDGYNTKYLRADGTWTVPPNTTYTASTISVGSASAGTAIAADDITAWSAGSVPSLTITSTACDDITAWSAGTAASASVSQGVLTITNGTAPSLSYTARTVGSASGWSAGTAPSLTYTARSIPNISVSSKTVVSGITAG